VDHGDVERRPSLTRGSQLIAEFTDAPIVEVIAGVAFDGLPVDAGPYLAVFWHDHLRQRFPNVQQQPTYTPPREVFGQERHAPGFQFEFGQGLPPTRLWASNPDGQELIQVQPGWFACNWRKVAEDSEYDHWPKRRRALSERFSEFADFLENEGLGTVKLTQCEVTYVNHVRPNSLWATHADAAKIFNVTFPSDPTTTLEQISTEVQVALSRDGRQWGRMYIKINPAFAQDGRTPLYVLELTVRGPAHEVGGDLEPVTTFMDKAREAIVRTFLAITSADMQSKVWGGRNERSNE